MDKVQGLRLPLVFAYKARNLQDWVHFLLSFFCTVLEVKIEPVPYQIFFSFSAFPLVGAFTIAKLHALFLAYFAAKKQKLLENDYIHKLI